jgi:DHA1 family inner membrane transport protein
VVASGADGRPAWTGALVSGLTVLTALYFIYLQRRDTAAVNVTG